MFCYGRCLHEHEQSGLKRGADTDILEHTFIPTRIRDGMSRRQPERVATSRITAAMLVPVAAVVVTSVVVQLSLLNQMIILNLTSRKK